MGSPFNTDTAATARPLGSELATYAQLERALAPMLRDRNWQSAGLDESWVRRIATINATLHIAQQVATDGRMAAQLKLELTDRLDLFTTFHQLMAFGWDSAVNDERDPAVSKPLTKKGASVLIDTLGQLQFKDRGRSQVEEANVAAAKAANEVAAPEVPAGRYAVATEDGATNELAFYKVDHGKGRWAGRVFVSRIVGGNDDIAVRGAGAKTVLAKIAADPAAASAAYGHEIGACGVCGITLTNDESRARGIGPKCAAKHGW